MYVQKGINLPLLHQKEWKNMMFPVDAQSSRFSGEAFDRRVACITETSKFSINENETHPVGLIFKRHFVTRIILNASALCSLL
jgi:hypothetical protein